MVLHLPMFSWFTQIEWNRRRLRISFGFMGVRRIKLAKYRDLRLEGIHFILSAQCKTRVMTPKRINGRRDNGVKTQWERVTNDLEGCVHMLIT